MAFGVSWPARLFTRLTRRAPTRCVWSSRSDTTESSPADAMIVNTFNHAYRNLNEFPERDPSKAWAQPEVVDNHYLCMPYSDLVVEANSIAISSGWLIPAPGVLDFSSGRALGEGIRDAAATNRDPCGYNYPCQISGWKPHGPPAPQPRAI